MTEIQIEEEFRKRHHKTILTSRGIDKRRKQGSILIEWVCQRDISF